ncbi:hypothetical protein Back11_10740 [Paenibacillus baekrokdamisoli]|uniref:Uncharacterized protein n=1 Tax=Paenibacillus baekrokdamisoli TaxID=1712516 RepID=A0A3G9J9T2_9BACL|nr:hypothetical protein [Paenibacillus baekrokdamisoli]MBB3067079.1 hypothetical protein [Paenibacillus baekrokdamisoli]BBH19729.1 hypothetical protein Back11_10740 [Paenibacillus baekrokdamisoli]
MGSHANYARWIWVELIGFDNEHSDYAVKAYIDNLGFVPDALSLLFFTPEFVHNHENMEIERALPRECCSYTARPYNRERARQAWTNHQLRNLIAELQKYNIAVYCSFFNIYEYNFDGEKFRGDWSDKHSYLCERMKSGLLHGLLNPLKRFENQTYYEDFFISKLTQVLTDYGFNGYHGADGYTSGRITLAEGDYSDDMVGQFIASRKLESIAEITAFCEGRQAEFEQRAEWIWANLREEWIAFYADRWELFWQKVVAAVHRDHRKVVFNTAWTRDPFEALYRYGVDYRRIANTGIDGFVVETVGASLIMGAGGVEMNPHYDFLAMLMTIKAYVPKVDLYCLNAIQDTTERWDALRHAPTILERDIYSLSNVFWMNEAGALNRCSTGFVACLSDGIHHHEWKWIHNRWNLAFGEGPKQILGATMIWSDYAFNNQLSDYVRTRGWSTHKLLHELISRGAPIHSIVNIKFLEQAHGAILVPHSHLLSEDERRAVSAYSNGPVIMIGPELSDIQEDQLSCAVYGEKGRLDQSFTADQELLTADELKDINDPKYWVHELYFQRISDDFLQKCANVIGEHTGSPQILQGAAVIEVTALQLSDNYIRLFIGNDHVNYSEARIEMGKRIVTIAIRTDFPGTPVIPEGKCFNVRVPGRGIVVLDVATETN